MIVTSSRHRCQIRLLLLLLLLLLLVDVYDRCAIQMFVHFGNVAVVVVVVVVVVDGV